MDALSFFDAEKYFGGICQSNIYAQDNGFRFCTCSGIESLQGPLDRFRTDKAFFCLDDTNDGAMFQGRGGGWYKRRTFTVFIVRRYNIKDEADRARQLGICRRLFRQVASKLLVDADDKQNDLVYLHVDNILSRELGQYFMSGCTGLYFMVDVSEPVDLKYREDEWRR